MVAFAVHLWFGKVTAIHNAASIAWPSPTPTCKFEKSAFRYWAIHTQKYALCVCVCVVFSCSPLMFMWQWMGTKVTHSLIPRKSVSLILHSVVELVRMTLTVGPLSYEIPFSYLKPTIKVQLHYCINHYIHHLLTSLFFSPKQNTVCQKNIALMKILKGLWNKNLIQVALKTCLWEWYNACWIGTCVVHAQ